MPKIEIAYDDQVARRRLADLRERGGNLAPAMREIAGHLLDSVNEAFAREASPAGKAWAPLKPATVDERLRRRYGSGPILERSGDLGARILADWDKTSAVVGTTGVSYLRESDMDLQCTAVFRRVPEGYIAFVEEFPGVNTQGVSLEEARANLREAVALVVEANRMLAREEAAGGAVIREPLIVTA